MEEAGAGRCAASALLPTATSTSARSTLEDGGGCFNVRRRMAAAVGKRAKGSAKAPLRGALFGAAAASSGEHGRDVVRSLLLQAIRNLTAPALRASYHAFATAIATDPQSYSSCGFGPLCFTGESA